MTPISGRGRAACQRRRFISMALPLRERQGLSGRQRLMAERIRIQLLYFALMHHCVYIFIDYAPLMGVK